MIMMNSSVNVILISYLFCINNCSVCYRPQRISDTLSIRIFPASNEKPVSTSKYCAYVLIPNLPLLIMNYLFTKILSTLDQRQNCQFWRIFGCFSACKSWWFISSRPVSVASYLHPPKPTTKKRIKCNVVLRPVCWCFEWNTRRGDPLTKNRGRLSWGVFAPLVQWHMAL